MIPADFEKFRDGVEGVYSFYRQSVSEFHLDVWWNSLKRFDLPAVVQAFNRHLMNPDTGCYLPKPADIVKMLAGTTLDAALVEWSKVDKAVREVGPYQTVVFDNPTTQRVLHDMGGWIGLSHKSGDEWPFVAKEFENRYRGFAMRSEMPDCPQKLIGIAEAYAEQNGLKVEPPVLIGDRTRAIAILQGGPFQAIEMRPVDELTMRRLGSAK